MTDKTTENQDAVIYRAAEIKLELKALEEEYTMLQPQVIQRVKELSADKDKYALAVGDLGTFSLAKYRKYKYTNNVDQIDFMLKEQKKKEEADGSATVTETEVLKFNQKKEGSA